MTNITGGDDFSLRSFFKGTCESDDCKVMNFKDVKI